MRENSDTPLAAAIENKLDNQGFLNCENLTPFIEIAIIFAWGAKKRDILIDGYPRCLEQLHSSDSWPFNDKLQWRRSHRIPPDVVLTVHTTKSTAQTKRRRSMSAAREIHEIAWRSLRSASLSAHLRPCPLRSSSVSVGSW